MEYKLGDRVRIKSFDWYNQNKNEDGIVRCGDKVFDDYMSVFCGSIVTIGEIYYIKHFQILMMMTLKFSLLKSSLRNFHLR